MVNFNRMMLPTYYGLLKMCCIESRIFRRQLAQHQNIQWAFKNITPYYTQYTMACEELFKLMALFVKPFKKTEGNSLQPSYLKLSSKFHYFAMGPSLYYEGNVHKGRPTIMGHFGHTYLPNPSPIFSILCLLRYSDFC